MGLSTKDLTQIKETLASGKKPRVVFTESAGQIAGQVGHVVQLEDPSVSDEWIMVKFGADILPFPPTDLSMAPRGAAAKRAAEPAPPPPPAPEFKVVREQVPAARKEKSTPPAPTPAPAPVKAASQEKTTVTDTDNAAPAPRKPAAAKPAKAKPLPSFTVTVSYTEGEWTVGAVQGSKALAKPYVIKPSDALKMVSLLDVPGVAEAVETIMSAERAQAQAVAEKLRAELAEVEAKLAELGT